MHFSDDLDDTACAFVPQWSIFKSTFSSSFSCDSYEICFMILFCSLVGTSWTARPTRRTGQLMFPFYDISSKLQNGNMLWNFSRSCQISTASSSPAPGLMTYHMNQSIPLQCSQNECMRRRYYSMH